MIELEELISKTNINDWQKIKTSGMLNLIYMKNDIILAINPNGYALFKKNGERDIHFQLNSKIYDRIILQLETIQKKTALSWLKEIINGKNH